MSPVELQPTQTQSSDPAAHEAAANREGALHAIGVARGAIKNSPAAIDAHGNVLTQREYADELQHRSEGQKLDD